MYQRFTSKLLKSSQLGLAKKFSFCTSVIYTLNGYTQELPNSNETCLPKFLRIGFLDFNKEQEIPKINVI